MLVLYVDFNEAEVFPDGNQAGAIFFGVNENPPALEQKMATGLRVILYDSGDRYEGVLRRGTRFDWVADLISGTTRELAPGEFERLKAETLRAAEQSE